MTRQLLAKLLRRRPGIVAVCVLLGCLAGLAYGLLLVPTYSSTSQVFITMEGNPKDPSAEETGDLYIKQRLNTYARVVSGRRVMQDVRSRLRLEASPESLGRQIRVLVPPETSLLDIEARDADPVRATRIADAVAESLSRLLPTIEDAQDAERTGSAQSPGSGLQVRISRSAEVPDRPITPNLLLDIVFGILLGATGGLALAVLRDRLDTVIRSLDDAAGVADVARLGSIPAHQEIASLDHRDPSDRSPFSEAIRELRSNLLFMGGEAPPQVVLVTSAAPGDGRTTVATHLAISLARAGAAAILVDADMRGPGVADLLGLDPAAGLTSLLAGTHDLSELVIPVGTSGLQVLQCGPVPLNSAEVLASRTMSAALTRLRDLHEVIVIDVPSLRLADASLLVRQADVVVVVARHGKTSVTDLERGVASLRRAQSAPIGLVFNAVPADAQSTPGHTLTGPEFARHSGGHR